MDGLRGPGAPGQHNPQPAAAPANRVRAARARPNADILDRARIEAAHIGARLEEVFGQPRPASPLNVHRNQADENTRTAVERMMNRYGIPTDVNVAVREARTYIGAMHNTDMEVVARKALALRTLSKERRCAPNGEVLEEWLGITDPHNTYYVGAAAASVKSAKEVFASLWRAIDTLQASSVREDARTLFVAALAACQQPDGDNVLSHVCAPGQFQQITLHMQSYFPDSIRVAPRMTPPHAYLRILFEFIETLQSAPGNLPPSAHAAVLERARQLSAEATEADIHLFRTEHLNEAQLRERGRLLDEGVRDTLEIYGLNWTPLSAPRPALVRHDAMLGFMPIPRGLADALILDHGLALFDFGFEAAADEVTVFGDDEDDENEEIQPLMQHLWPPAEAENIAERGTVSLVTTLFEDLDNVYEHRQPNFDELDAFYHRSLAYGRLHLTGEDLAAFEIQVRERLSLDWNYHLVD